MRPHPIVLIKGAGDVATGVAHTLAKNGFRIVMTEISKPTTERRAVAFSEAIYENEWEVEGLRAKKTEIDEVDATFFEGKIPVVVDPIAEIRHRLKPDIIIDAIMAKKNTGTRINDAPITIALGPGFEAGKDVHVVVETSEGPNLGRPYFKGTTQAFHGQPCKINGKAHERVFRAPKDGILKVLVSIGEHIEVGQTLATVDGLDVKAEISGVLRGIMHDGSTVTKSLKLGDIDPRDEKERCFMIAERSAIISEGVLEAIKIFISKDSIQIQKAKK